MRRAYATAGSLSPPFARYGRRIYGVGMEHLDHEECLLTSEQEFLLARLCFEAAPLSREELIEHLVSAYAQKMSMVTYFTEILAEHGIAFRMQDHPIFDPTDMDSLVRLFGYEPSDAEVEELAYSSIEAATMEVDMDAIVLAPED